MALVNVEHLSRVYRQDSIAVKALDDVSMTIEAGEFTTLFPDVDLDGPGRGNAFCFVTIIFPHCTVVEKVSTA